MGLETRATAIDALVKAGLFKEKNSIVNKISKVMRVEKIRKIKSQWSVSISPGAGI